MVQTNWLRVALLGMLLTAMSLSKVQASVINVAGDANIFGAGHASPPAGAFGAGTLPPGFTFSAAAGQILTFSSVTGTVRIDDDNTPGYSNGADGGTLYTRTDVSSAGGIAGVVDDSRTMFLVGVFLDSTEPSDPAPARLDFSSSSLGENFSSLSPLLGQLFFIGDGLTGTGTGAVQQFSVPASATRLFLGFADSYSFGTNTISGPPGFYGDNDGTLVATFDISGASAVPEPSSFALLALGIAGLVARRRRLSSHSK